MQTPHKQSPKQKQFKFSDYWTEIEIQSFKNLFQNDD